MENKRVLVIHPFIDTIRRQYEKRKLLFSTEFLPRFKELSFVKTVQSSAGGYADLKYKSCFEALEYMKSEIDKVSFDVALVGAGAYEMLLSAYCKKTGKQYTWVVDYRFYSKLEGEDGITLHSLRRTLMRIGCIRLRMKLLNRKKLLREEVIGGKSCERKEISSITSS